MPSQPGPSVCGPSVCGPSDAAQQEWEVTSSSSWLHLILKVLPENKQTAETQFSPQVLHQLFFVAADTHYRAKGFRQR